MCIRRVRYSFFLSKLLPAVFIQLEVKCYFIINNECQIIIARIHLETENGKNKILFEFLEMDVYFAY